MDRANDIWEAIRQVNARLEENRSLDERQRLLDEKAALQLRARELAAADIPTGVLETELAEAQRRWIVLQGDRIDHVRHAGGGDFSGDVKAGVDVIYMNKRIDEAQGRAELEARISALRRMIEDRNAATE